MGLCCESDHCCAPIDLLHGVVEKPSAVYRFARTPVSAAHAEKFAAE
jgi:hypothetical protein